MTTHVTFEYPALFVGTEEGDGSVLSIKGADWFLAILVLIPDIEIDRELFQEDWGVIIFVNRRGKRFWIGLSGEGAKDAPSWIAHFHHGHAAWLQRFSASGKRELMALIRDFHQDLLRQPLVAHVSWHQEKDLITNGPKGGSSTPW